MFRFSVSYNVFFPFGVSYFYFLGCIYIFDARLIIFEESEAIIGFEMQRGGLLW